MSQLHGIDAELLATGTSERFRQPYKGAKCATTYVDHTIAPQSGKDGGGRGAKRAKVAAIRENSLPAASQAIAPRTGSGVVVGPFNVNRKRALELGFVLGRIKSAVYVGPDEKHHLNHPTTGPMKRSAADGLAARQVGQRIFGADVG